MTYEKRSAFRYYWCVNCGHYGDFRKVRKRSLNCEKCGYDELTDYDEAEIKEDERLCLEMFKQKNS